MPANLDAAVFLFADIIGVVDRPGREPEQALFDGFEMIEIGGHDGPLQLQQSEGGFRISWRGKSIRRAGWVAGELVAKSVQSQRAHQIQLDVT